MKQLLLIAFAALLFPATASAQWTFQNTFPEDETRAFSSTHGIAVDPDGKVWIQPFGATDSIAVNGVFTSTRALYIFNADGTENEMSPYRVVDFADGTTPLDTLGLYFTASGARDTRSGRGMRTDCDGNILVSQYDALFKIDYETGEGLAKVLPVAGASLGEASSDADCNVYVGQVGGGNPIRQYSSDLTLIRNVINSQRTFSRNHQVSQDGLTLFETDFELPYTIIHSRPTAFNDFTDSTGVTLRGMRVESSAYNASTGRYWFSSGDPLSAPNEDVPATSWSPQTWYAFTLDDLLANEIPTPVDSIKWDNPANNPADENAGPRPRAIGFSPDGNTAYIGAFNQGAPSVQVFTRDASTPGVEQGAIAGVGELGQNVPNPASGATEIRFTLAKAAQARVRIFDVGGRELMTVVDEALAPGEYAREVSLSDLSTGTYIYTLEVEGQVTSRRMLVVR